jgi:hypothetical protein
MTLRNGLISGSFFSSYFRSRASEGQSAHSVAVQRGYTNVVIVLAGKDLRILGSEGLHVARAPGGTQPAHRNENAFGYM